jgi:hypothetical protein
MKKQRYLATVLGVAALAVPAAAVADKPDGVGKPDKPEKPDKVHNVNYVFKGAYSGDGSTVAVDHGNKHVRKAGLEDTAVQFDLTAAKVVVADTNADGAQDLTDVAAGDRVVVKARLPKGDPGAQPFAAKQLVDQTNAPAEEAPPAP